MGELLTLLSVQNFLQLSAISETMELILPSWMKLVYDVSVRN